MTRYLLERALIDGTVHPAVEVNENDGVIVSVTLRNAFDGPDRDASPSFSFDGAGAFDGPGATGDTVFLPGLTVPGFANAHSHAFHRALRGTTHGDGGSFWTWRDRMYEVADRLTPENYRALATAVFAEMVLAGYTVVGEFHYVHHAAGGVRHPDTHAMSEAIIGAAADAGIRLTLLDTIYLRGGLIGGAPERADAHLALDEHQARFGDGTAADWAVRHGELSERHGAGAATSDTVRIGAAVHSVRAVPREALAAVRAATIGQPVHAHVSEQLAENTQAQAAWGLTPLAVLADAALLDESFTAVHATHLSTTDVELLARTGATVCVCPTTERDLGDGIGPVGALTAAGVHLCIGSDQHAVIDPFDELRALEGHERLATLSRGRVSPDALMTAGATAGYRSLGWTGGAIAVGSVCDLVAINDRSVRTAGSRGDQIAFAASGSDVTDTVVGGIHIVAGGQHRLGDVAALMRDALAALDLPAARTTTATNKNPNNKNDGETA